METEQAFEAEAELDVLGRNRSSSTQSKWKGQDAVQSAAGGFESQRDIDHDETSSLLRSPGQKHSDSDGSTHVGDGEQSPPEWSGVHDFDGLPWWKRPSVSIRGIDTTTEQTSSLILQ